MDTSEALDLSKENIQPLKQGRNAVKLGTALQAQSNAELHQQLMAEREQFELLIRMYEGEDPLEPRYEYVRWIEQSFPKHGPDSNLVQVLENTLAAFKDDPRYKQDLRYADILIKYIDTQANPLEIYQIVYDQGLCTMCAPFYKAWAEEYDKINDIKSADRIFELGIKVKALPLELLPEAQLRFQLSLGRRMLGYQEEAPEDAERNRQALHKLQKKNMYGERDAVGAPGRVKQQALGTNNSKANTNAPFKIYQEDDNGFEGHGDGQGKMFPKQGLVNKENTLKAGPWTQQGGKHRSRAPAPTNHGPMFQVHEDDDADLGNGCPRTPSVPRALKPRKIDNFTCPLAVFEPPDPTKQPMYCKNKVYAGGSEFQFEELRAALYNRRYKLLTASRQIEEAEREEEERRRKAENEATYVKVAPDVIGVQDINKADNEKEMVNDLIAPLTNVVDRESLFQNHLHSPAEVKNETHNINRVEDVQQTQEHKSETRFEEPHIDQMGFEHKHLPLEGNTSVFHCQSFTVNTKEAMTVVQEMWQSPTPSPAFSRNMRASRAPVSPANLDESGVFKVPIAPAPHVPVAVSAKKSVPFPVFSDEEPSPAPTPPVVKTFQIYSDETENEQPDSQVKTVEENSKNSGVPLPFPIQQSPAVRATDTATMKMLAFQSDSDEDCDVLPKPCIQKEKEKPQMPFEVPAVTVTDATPVEGRKSLGFALHPPVYDEDKFEDMTCNTKAFDFALPSSTPVVGHFQSKADQNMKNNFNGSYIVEDVKKCGTRQDLSIVFEASKERYSSSSGSSGSKTQGSVCTVGNTTVPPAQPELLEKLAQISANKSVEEVDKSLGLLNISGSIDPFSTELITRLLAHVGYPRNHHLIGLHRQDSDCPSLHTNSTVTLGSTKYSVIGELGKGAYARVLKATRDSRPVALKQQRPAWEWEWYIVQELQSRLPANMMSGFLHMSTGYIYRNASILESEWAQYGSILSVVNKLKIAGKGNDLHLAVLFSIQLVSIIEHLHKCRIIHGDVKPDNFVLFSLPKVNLSEPCLKLIDFGRSIDMTLFPEDTTFSTVVTTDGFQCNEMKEGRPWTYQTDLYGLAGSIYCVLFYDYMKVVKKDKKWQLSSKVPRYMKPALWAEVFSTLLNVESCENQPNLTALRELLEQNYKEMDQASVQASINKLTNTLLNK